MKTVALVATLAATTVTAQVKPQCFDPKAQKLVPLIDAGDGARYLSDVIKTPWAQCAINGTDQTFQTDSDKNENQWHVKLDGSDAQYYCSKVYPNAANLNNGPATFLLCIDQQNVPTKSLHYGAKRSAGGDLLKFDTVEIDCKEVADAAYAMMANCGDLRDSAGQPVMGGVQPINANGTAYNTDSEGLPGVPSHVRAPDPVTGLFVVLEDESAPVVSTVGS